MAKKQGPRWEDLDKSMIDLSVLMQHYEVHNRTEGKSPRTVGWYNEVLGMLIKWLEDGRLPTSIGAINEDIIRQFILYIQERPGINGKLSSHTVANRVRALKAFFAWLDRKGYTRKNLLKELRSPKTVDRVIEPLSKEEVEKIFSGINSNTAMGARNSALVSLMLDTGLRLSEAAYLEEADLHLEERYVKVMGKGGKERIVAFGVACQRACGDPETAPSPASAYLRYFFLAKRRRCLFITTKPWPFHASNGATLCPYRQQKGRNTKPRVLPLR